MLRYPVKVNNATNRKPEWLLSAVQSRLIQELGGDPAYVGLLTKNPIHPKWETLWGDTELHVLQHMAGQLGLDLRSGGGRHPYQDSLFCSGNTSGFLGRNVLLFDATREWAYHAVRRYWSDGADAFHLAVSDHLLVLNSQLPVPLGTVELRHIAKSVADWVWEKFTPASFSDIQKARSAKATVKRQQTAAERAAQVQALREAGKTWAQVGQELGITADAARSVLKRRQANRR